MPSQLPWSLTEWHNISTSSPLKMDGVLFQDIKSVLDVISKYPEVVIWAKSVKDLYDHISDFDSNPHQVTADQFDTKPIDVIYEAWRQDGYIGSLEDFIKIFFYFMKIINFDELLDNLDKEDFHPTVDAVAKYIKRHNEDPYAHENLVRDIFRGPPPHVFPCLAAFQYQLDQSWLDVYYDPVKLEYRDVPAFGLERVLNDTCTIIADIQYLKGEEVFAVKGEKAVDINSFGFEGSKLLMFNQGTFAMADYFEYVVKTYPVQQKVVLVEQTAHSEISLITIDTTSFEHFFREPERHLSVALRFTYGDITLSIQPYSSTYTFPNIITQGIQKYLRGPREPFLRFPRMKEYDPLQSIAVYREAMTDEQLAYLFAHYQYPVILPRR